MAPVDEGTYSLQAEFTEWGVVYKSNEVPFKVRMLHLNDYSWGQIQQIIAAGQAPVTFAECFENGCCKEIPLSAGTTTMPYNEDGDTAISAQNIYVNILDFDHDEAANGEVDPNATFGMAAVEKIRDADENVINFKANQKTSQIDYSTGDWAGHGDLKESVAMGTEKWNNNDGAPVMNGFLNDVYEQCLPDDLKSAIIPVNKYTSAGGKSPEIVPTTPHLFILSVVEITGQWYMNADGSITEVGKLQNMEASPIEHGPYGLLCSYEGEGSQYEYYAVVNDITDLTKWIYRIVRFNGMWLRSPSILNGYCRIHNQKQLSYSSYCNRGWSVSFCFCIG